MTKKKTQAVSQDGENGHSRQSLPNTSGAARRRLLRAVGGSGGAALGVLLAGQWQKPIVKAVVLPAHAQTSPDEPVEAVGCLIAVSINEEANVCGPSDATVNIVVQSGGVSTELASIVVTASSASLSAASTFPPGTYGAIAGVTRLGIVFFQNRTVNWSCCDDTAAASSFFAGGAELSRTAIISDDGQCELSVPF